MKTLPRSTPEAEGVPSEALSQWMEQIDALEYVHSFILARHGRVIAEAWRAPYKPEFRHRLYSTSKSFVSVAVGLAASEGLLSLNDKIVSFFPEKRQSGISSRMKRVTIRHLLTMSSGHDKCAFEYIDKLGLKGDWVQAFLDSDLADEPGTRFVYNSGCTYMMSAMIRQVTGENVKEYLKPRLFDPLEITDLKWDNCPFGINIGGWGFHLKTEDIAKFAQLLLQKGSWEGRQLVPADYLAEATSRQIDNSMNTSSDWKVGYGYQFWRSQHNCFRADGWCGQYALVMPDQDMIMAMTSGVQDMQRILTATWDILLPVLRDRSLPADPGKHKRLKQSLSSWRMPLATGDLSQRGPDGIYHLEPNEPGFNSLAFQFDKTTCTLTFDGRNGAETLKAGFGFNLDNNIQLTDYEVSRVAASAAWIDPQTLELLTVWYETPFLTRFVCKFEGRTITLKEDARLRFKAQAWPLLTGTMS